MKIFDRSFKTPQENLACDEVLLEELECGRGGEVLRFWESPDYFAVLGLSNRGERELDVQACRKEGVGIFRRCSGGGTVLQGPGCLNYSLILGIDPKGPTANITATNAWIMENQRQAIEQALGTPVRILGHTDLAVGQLKFSGNAQRRQRKSILFHGTFLYDFDLSRIALFLKFPSRQPDYRRDRKHEDFLTNIAVAPERIKKALAEKWKVESEVNEIPFSRVAELAKQKYDDPGWNDKFKG